MRAQNIRRLRRRSHRRRADAIFSVHGGNDDPQRADVGGLLNIALGGIRHANKQHRRGATAALQSKSAR